MHDNAMRVHAWAELAARPRTGLWAAGVIAVLGVAGTLALWARYGSTVFLETIMAGIAACL